MSNTISLPREWLNTEVPDCSDRNQDRGPTPTRPHEIEFRLATSADALFGQQIEQIVDLHAEPLPSRHLVNAAFQRRPSHLPRARARTVCGSAPPHLTTKSESEVLGFARVAEHPGSAWLKRLEDTSASVAMTL